MNGYIFRIDLPDDRRQAVVCVRRKYASVLRDSQIQPERLVLSQAVWSNIARELSQPHPSTPLRQHSAVVSALVEPELRAAARVRYLIVLPFDPSPDDLQRRLDALHAGFGGLYLSGKLGWW